MNIIYVLLTLSLIMASIFLGIFIWNLRQGQFDDDYTPSVRMLFEDEPPRPQEKISECGGRIEKSVLGKNRLKRTADNPQLAINKQP